MIIFSKIIKIKIKNKMNLKKFKSGKKIFYEKTTNEKFILHQGTRFPTFLNWNNSISFNFCSFKNKSSYLRK